MADIPTPDAILEEAVGISDSEQRSAYLDQVCEGDSELRAEVESLLSAYCAGGSFLDAPAMPAVEAPGEKEGDRIGHYKLLELIGEGGFGRVWMAEQREPMERRVALKIVKLGMDTGQVVARFEAERNALAMMDHPNIATIHDGGATESGRPYFVMELVHGVPITEYCDANKLPPGERIDLFRRVCVAVQHAHQKGVIHRDLKPSNILVTVQDDKPVPKVIDFGVAKALDKVLAERTLFTGLNQRVGTPEYMSPEQAGLGSLDVDMRSDVYTLGVLLYELLIGRTPFGERELREQAYDAILRKIREEDPPKASTRLSSLTREELTDIADHRGQSPGKLGHLIHGELDWILLKALERDRTRRYQSPNALATDLARLAAGEPISAVPPSFAYQAGKFIRRNWKAVTVAATIAMLLIAGVFGTSWFAFASKRSEEQERKAKEEAIASGLETQVALARSRYEEAKTWLERARLQRSQNNGFAAAIMAAKGLGFRGFGAEGQSPEFRKTLHPALLDKEKPEFEQLMQIAISGGGSVRPVWQTRVGADQASGVMAVAFSPDGRTLAGASGHAVMLWDVPSGQKIQTLEGNQEAVKNITFSPDGSIVAGRSGGTIKLWDVSSGAEIRMIEGHQSGFSDVAFSPDGSTLAGGYQKGVKLWQVSSGVEIKTLEGHPVGSVTFSPDGRILASGSRDGTIKLWEVSSGKEIRSLEGHQDDVLDMAFSPDGTMLASGSRDFSVKLWDTSSGVEIHSLEGNCFYVGSVAFSPDGSTLASGSWDSTYRLNSTDSNAFAGRGDGKIKLWDVSTGKELHSIYGQSPQGREWGVNSVDFSPDGNILASGSCDNTITLWDLGPGKMSQSLNWPQHQIDTIAISPKGNIVVGGGGVLDFLRNPELLRSAGKGDGLVRLWDAASGRELGMLAAHPFRARGVVFSPDGTTLATTGTDRSNHESIKLWNVTSGEEIRSLDWDPGIVTALAFSRDGSLLATGGMDRVKKMEGTIKLWDVRTGKEFPSPELHHRFVTGVDFSPDSSVLYSVSISGTIKLWDVRTGKEILSMQAHKSSITSVALSPDGRILASGGGGENNGIIKLWKMPSGKHCRTLVGHPFMVKCVAFSPDGRTLASGSSDRTIKLWDVSSGFEIATLKGHQDVVTSVAFTPDGTALASGSRDGTIKFWAAGVSRLELANYLDARNPWCPLDEARIEWTTTASSPHESGESEFLNISTHSHLGILRSNRSRAETNRALFWTYLHAGNWNSAEIMYGRLEDSETRDMAREMMIRKRTERASAAIEAGRRRHAQWHLNQIEPLLKDAADDSALEETRATIEELARELADESGPEEGRPE